MQVSLSTTFVTTQCGRDGCDAVFAFEQSFYEARRHDHATWYCPNGHPRCYAGESDDSLGTPLRPTPEGKEGDA